MTQAPSPAPGTDRDAHPGGGPSAPSAPPRPGPARSREEARAMFREQLEAQARLAARRPVKGRRAAFPRALPWDSPVSRLGAGTKIVCLLALTSVLLWVPRWPTIALVAAVLVLAARLARVPGSVVPRGPWWIWWGIFWGGVTSVWGGGLEPYVRSVVLGVVLLGATFVLLWTTRPEHLAPAFAGLLRPLRLVGLPVDEWARTMGLSLRGLPTLAAELQALNDASRLRGGWQRRLAGRRGVRAQYGAMLREWGDVVTAAISAADRRATATGRAMTLRGGVAPVRREQARPGLRDLVALALTAGVVAASLWLR